MRSITGPVAKDPREVFEENYISEPNSGCWLWTGALSDSGYGRLGMRKTRMPAHRFSLQMHTTESGDGLFACHRCDTPACVNPDHLFWGTTQDNMADMCTKGRHGCGPYKAHIPLFPCGHSRFGGNALPTTVRGINTSVCRECGRLRAQKSNARRRLERLNPITEEIQS